MANLSISLDLEKSGSGDSVPEFEFVIKIASKSSSSLNFTKEYSNFVEILKALKFNENALVDSKSNFFGQFSEFVRLGQNRG